ncbi:hypothetical protein FRC03_007786 [Tulasnella sp. 419]|nr:hypothetical protein FRC03_007786 [Tulasnella sp. 419]
MSSEPKQRETAYRIFANVPQLIMDQDIEQVIGVLERGLADQSGPDVRLAALKASTAYLSSADKQTRAEASRLMSPALQTLVNLPSSSLAAFLQALIPLATSEPYLFRPHLQSLLAFLSPLLLLSYPPNRDATGTETTGATSEGASAKSETDARDEARLSALELLVTLTEASPNSAQACPGWVPDLVRCCLEGMAQITGELEDWAANDPSHEVDDDEDYSRAYEESLDRSAVALGGAAILPSVFQYVPDMLNSNDWQQRHAGLMAISCVAEGTAPVLQKDIGIVIQLILPLFNDSHPRVRHSACHCIGQLCTDMEGAIQSNFAEQVLRALIPLLHAPEPRVHSHAAAGLVNFCTGASSSTITPYLDDIIKGLLSMLNSSSKPYVQNQALTTLAMVADAAQKSFKKYYPALMPIVLAVLKNANTKDLRVLRCRAMECGGLMATAVGKEMFKSDAGDFADTLLQIQNQVNEPDDPTIPYLNATWAKVAQVMKADFTPYLQFVMPPLLRAASLKPEMSILSEDENLDGNSDWQTVRVGAQRVGIRTAVLEEKLNAFDIIIIHCGTLGSNFVDYVAPVLEICLPNLRYVYHEGVQEDAATLIPMLLACGKSVITPTVLHTVFTELLAAITAETEFGVLSSLYRSVSEALMVAGIDNLTPQLAEGITKATQNHLQTLAERRRKRADYLQSEDAIDIEELKEDMGLMEELEEFALEEMNSLIKILDPNHALLVAIGSVKELGVTSNFYSEDNAPTP